VVVVSETRVGMPTMKPHVFEIPAALAVRVTDVLAATGVVITLNVVERLPAGTVTVAGT